MNTSIKSTDSLREQYFNKEIFNVGDLVESNQVQFKIISRGTNYIFLEDQYGNRAKKWIQDVTLISEKAKESSNIEDVHIDDSDESIDKMIKHINSFDDIADLYDDDELHIVDHEGKHHSNLSEDIITEVLSRMERIKARIRFAQSASKRERKLTIALHTRSSTAKINHRARILAVKLLKLKFAKKPLDQLTFQDKERLEHLLSKKKVLLSRMAMKLSPKIRAIENTRLEKVTKGSPQ